MCDLQFGVRVRCRQFCREESGLVRHVSHIIIIAPILHHVHWSWYCSRSVSIPAIIIRRHFHRKRIKPVTVWRAAIVLCSSFIDTSPWSRFTAKKKERQTMVIQQQSASRVQLPVVVCSEREEPWEAAPAICSKNKADENEGACRVGGFFRPCLGPKWRGQLIRWRGQCVQHHEP